jgi:hypothetical protein
MGSLEVSEGKKLTQPQCLQPNPIIRMNLSASQTKLVQSWGLGHSNPSLIHNDLVKCVWCSFKAPYKAQFCCELGARNFMYENKKCLHKLIKTSSLCVGKFGYAYLGIQLLCKHLPSCTSNSTIVTRWKAY